MQLVQPDSVSTDPAVLAAWVTVLLTLVGILCALFAVWWQIRKQRLMHSAAMITGLADRFASEEWRAYRMQCAAAIRAHRRGEEVDLKDFPVLGFFENIGHLVRRNVLDAEMVWTKFGWSITRYHLALTRTREAMNDETRTVNLIEANRETEHDRTLWKEFEWVNRRMLVMYAEHGVNLLDPKMIDERVDELLRDEARLMDPARFWTPRAALPGGE